MEFTCLSNWKLDSYLFYPTGIKFIEENDKYAAIIWNFNSLTTLLFRDFHSAMVNNLKCDKLHYLEINEEGSIKDLIILGQQKEPIVLTENGCIYNFQSPRSLVKNYCFDGIKYICPHHNSGFAMIRLTPDNQIQIEIYAKALTENNKVKSFDISFEDKLPNTTWNDSKFCLKVLLATNVEHDFYSLFQKSVNYSNEALDSCLIFSVNNLLFTLHHTNIGVEYKINHIYTCSSEIVNIWVSKDSTILFLLLESTLIDILYVCKKLGILRKSNLCLGDDISAIEMIDEDVFVYSDTFKIVKCKVAYNAHNQEFETCKIVINMSGVAALTFLAEENCVFGITENKAIYKIPMNQDIDDYLNLNVVELPDDYKHFAQTHTVNIDALTDTFNDLNRKIILESKKYQMLATKKNHWKSSVWNDLFEAEVKACHTEPIREESLFFNLTHNPTNEFLINVRISQLQPLNDIYNIFDGNARWKVIVSLNSHHSITFNSMFNLSQQQVNVLIGVPKNDKNCLTIPTIQLELCSCSGIGMDFLYISFPIRMNSIDFRGLIKAVTMLPQNNANIENALVYRIKLPLNWSLVDLIKALCPELILPNSSSKMQIVLFQSNMYMELVENLLVLKSKDPMLMWLIKSILQDRLADEDLMIVEENKTILAQLYNIGTCCKDYDETQLINNIINARNLYTSFN